MLWMKRCLLYLPLIGLGPLLSFCGAYLMGRGAIGEEFWVLLGVGCVYVAVPVFFGFIVGGSGLMRYFVCMGALLVEVALVASAPACMPNAKSMGVAHRLKREFPIDQVRVCADQLLERYRAKTLVSADKDNPQAELWSKSEFAVDRSELPASLRERVRWVRITKVQRGFTEDLQVFFFIDWERSIICDSRPFVNNEHLSFDPVANTNNSFTYWQSVCRVWAWK